MTGAEAIIPPIAGVVVRLAVERAAPAGFAIVKSWLFGKKIMVVGPGGSGKTTFVKYLQYGVFQHEEEYSKTYTIQRSPRLNLKVGPSKNIEVFVKSIVDVPGQGADLANDVFVERPDGLVVIVDLSQPFLDVPGGKKPWIQEFFERLEFQWQQYGHHGKNRLKSTVVVMNKMDKIDRADIASRTSAYQEIIDRNFRIARGPSLDNVFLKPCIMVDNPDGTKWVDAILVDLTRFLV